MFINVCMYVCLAIYLCVWLTVCLSVYLNLSLSLFLSLSLSLSLSLIYVCVIVLYSKLYSVHKSSINHISQDISFVIVNLQICEVRQFMRSFARLSAEQVWSELHVGVSLRETGHLQQARRSVWHEEVSPGFRGHQLPVAYVLNHSLIFKSIFVFSAVFFF